eukprot:Nk52_evm4s265 gene=Nk52_evmTU4s265
MSKSFCWSVAVVCALSLILLSSTESVQAFEEGFYCGLDSCYDVLGVKSDATKAEIRRAYRKLSLEFHPDKNPGDEEAAKNFTKIATAYEILRDDGQREDYDYMVANPNEHYLHHWRYYKRRTAAKVNVWLVVVVSLAIVSVLQYFSTQSKYNTGLRYMTRNPKIRAKLVRLVEEKGMQKELKAARKRGQSEEEKILVGLLESDCKHAYVKPEWKNTVGVQTLLLPYTAIAYAIWYVKWYYKHTYLGEPYNDEEKEYLTRKALGMSVVIWGHLEDWEKEEFIEKKLWEPENLEAYQAEMKEKELEKLRDSSQYKRYKRFRKNAEPEPL